MTHVASLLPDLDINESMRAHGDTRYAEAEEEYKDAFGALFSTVKTTIDDVASQHTKPVPAMKAATTFCTQLTDFLEDNNGRITTGFAPGNLAGGGPVQARELEAAEQRANDAERELQSARDNQAQLERNARDVSNMRDQVAVAEQETARVKRELSAAQAEVQRLKADGDKPNPLKARVNELETENSRLQRELDAAIDAREAIERESLELHQQLKAIRENAEQQAAQSDNPSGNEPSASFIAGTMERQNGSDDEPSSPPQPKRRLRPNRKAGRSGTND